MKTKVGVVFVITLQLTLFGCNDQGIVIPSQEKAQADQTATQIKSLPADSLSQNEITSLAFMREEEKLAHDVYVTLYDKWQLTIFSNISQSEETHTQAVLALLEKYGLPDPVGDNGIGIFENEGLQALYDQLIAQGSQSLLEGLIVGAIIEEKDILDIKNSLEETDNQDIIFVYSNLLKGSRNHLRSFYDQLLKRDYVYKAQFIEQSELEEIIISPKETGSI